jgi:hypothetical protein
MVLLEINSKICLKKFLNHNIRHYKFYSSKLTLDDIICLGENKQSLYHSLNELVSCKNVLVISHYFNIYFSVIEDREDYNLSR